MIKGKNQNAEVCNVENKDQCSNRGQCLVKPDRKRERYP